MKIKTTLILSLEQKWIFKNWNDSSSNSKSIQLFKTSPNLNSKSKSNSKSEFQKSNEVQQQPYCFECYMNCCDI